MTNPATSNRQQLVSGAKLQTVFRQQEESEFIDARFTVELRTPADLAKLPPAVPLPIRDAIADVVEAAQGTGVVIAGLYDSCTEYSMVVPGNEPGTVEFVVVTDEPDTMCAWSPQVIDTWTVPMAAFER